VVENGLNPNIYLSPLAITHNLSIRAILKVFVKPLLWQVYPFCLAYIFQTFIM
jgi:hypothetical protein